MLELFVIACAIANPTDCKTVQLTFAPTPGAAMRCQMGLAGQDMIAKWQEANPRWAVRKWRCQRAGVVAKA